MQDNTVGSSFLSLLSVLNNVTRLEWAENKKVITRDGKRAADGRKWKIWKMEQEEADSRNPMEKEQGKLY